LSTYDTQTTDGPSSTSSADQAKEKAQQTADQAKDKAQQAAGQARGQLRSQIDERSTQAGEQVGTVANDVRSVGEELRKQGKEQPAKIADGAAKQAEKVGDYLKRADGDTILRDAEDFGRRQPWAVMFGGLAVGFLASRFLKASSTRRYESSRQLPARTADVPPVPSSGPGAGLPASSTPGYTRDPAMHEPGPTRPAEDVSLTGGVMPGRGTSGGGLA
jgi:hypothetical protein